MKVKTDYVPEDALKYLTPGKSYDVVECTLWDSETCVIFDNGEEHCINIPSCAHLDFKPWQIVGGLPITAECDALREENEMLAAENRRLLNEIAELRKYPEVAERVVFDYSLDLGNEAGHDGEVFLSDAFEHYAEEVARIFIEALQKGE